MFSAGNRRGFTLLELLLTLAILAIAASLVGPAFVRMVENRRLESASRQISAALRQAREQAIREQRVLAVKFSSDGRGVSLLEAGGKVRGEIALATGVRVREIRPGDTTGAVLERAEVEFQTTQEGPRILLFTPSGGAEEAEIFLENERGRELRIRTDGFTGLARVERVAQSTRR